MDPWWYKRFVLWLLFSPLRNLPWCGAPLPGGYKTYAQFLSCGGIGLISFAFPEIARLPQLAFCAVPPGEAVLWSPAALLRQALESGMLVVMGITLSSVSQPMCLMVAGTERRNYIFHLCKCEVSEWDFCVFCSCVEFRWLIQIHYTFCGSISK